jgi:hypothetical protein
MEIRGIWMTLAAFAIAISPAAAHAFGSARTFQTGGTPAPSSSLPTAATSPPSLIATRPVTPPPAPTTVRPVPQPTLTATPIQAPRSCEQIPEQITLHGSGTLSFPRSGLFVIESHYLSTHDALSVQSDTSGIANHLNYSCSLLKKLGLSVSADCHEVYPGYLATWTPAEGGGNVGVGARSGYRPSPIEEMFQGNLYYASGQLPPPGTRYLITNRASGKTIVASFGYEVGPASSKWLGGLTPEAHFYLDQYRYENEPLEIGRAADQTLPFGPIQCN